MQRIDYPFFYLEQKTDYPIAFFSRLKNKEFSVSKKVSRALSPLVGIKKLQSEAKSSGQVIDSK